jgi:hypothetical protein
MRSGCEVVWAVGVEEEVEKGEFAARDEGLLFSEIRDGDGVRGIESAVWYRGLLCVEVGDGDGAA